MFEDEKNIRKLLGEDSLIEIINLITEYVELSHLLKQILNEINNAKGSLQNTEKLEEHIRKALNVLSQRIHHETIFLEKIKQENRFLWKEQISVSSESS